MSIQPAEPNDYSPKGLCQDYTFWYHSVQPPPSVHPPEQVPGTTAGTTTTTTSCDPAKQPNGGIDFCDDLAYLGNLPSGCIAQFLNDTQASSVKWTKACCWQVENLTPNTPAGDGTGSVCEHAGFTLNNNFEPTKTCDAAIAKYCESQKSPDPFCGCWNTDDISKDREDELLYQALKSKNSQLSPNCVMNRCISPLAYKTKHMQSAQCPNICAAMSSSPNNQTSVSVECSPDDIIINTYKNLLNPSKVSEVKSSPAGANTKPIYRSPIFYILLAIVFALLILLTVMIVRRKRG